MKKTVAVIGSESGHNDQRLRNWATVASTSGFQVLFCTRYGKFKGNPFDKQSGIEQFRYILTPEEYELAGLKNKTDLLIGLVNLPFIRSLFRYFLPELIVAKLKPKLLQFEPDVVVACGLNALKVAQKVQNQTGCQIIYDSPELEQHRNARYSLNLQRKRRWLERKALKQVNVVTVPSPSIAAYLANAYNLRNTPIVIYNIPLQVCGEEDVGTSPEPANNQNKIILYVGYRGNGRGLEWLLRALQLLPENFRLVCIGGSPPENDKKLLKLAESLSISHRIELCGPVPPEDVIQEISFADVSFIGVENRCLSYYYALPNKLFQSFQAGLPVVAPAFPDILKVVEETGMGLCFHEFEANQIAEALQKASSLKNDPNWEEKCTLANKKFSPAVQRKIMIDLLRPQA
ncbi:glycosyltransferase family 4 protein [Sneathiella limimaris]|uniref:glycosyltransferase family 4 protein n=1 Tax=Sneathiella limimaris TaxID=1964213 RepID=UPI00146B4FD5|nr:glycosyltransferase family 4 protein [Sneathiella limimaris]